MVNNVSRAFSTNFWCFFTFSTVEIPIFHHFLEKIIKISFFSTDILGTFPKKLRKCRPKKIRKSKNLFLPNFHWNVRKCSILRFLRRKFSFHFGVHIYFFQILIFLICILFRFSFFCIFFLDFTKSSFLTSRQKWEKNSPQKPRETVFPGILVKIWRKRNLEFFCFFWSTFSEFLWKNSNFFRKKKWDFG